MIKKLTLFITLFLITTSVYCQISEGGTPYSVKHNLSFDGIDNQTVYSKEIAQIQQTPTKQREQRAEFGRVIPTKLNLKNTGTWQTLPNGDRLWQLKITSKKALALSLYYDDFYLPNGTTFFVFNEHKTQVLGAFNARNNTENRKFVTGIVEGQTSILEYYEPKSVKGKGRISISGVGHAYRLVPNSLQKDFGDSQPCQVNVNCSEGGNWTDQIKSVVRILTVDNGSQAWCSGAMVNNIKEDCKPYLLTAEHCGITTTPSEFSQWIFYFNYESPNCTNPANEGNLANSSVTGASVVARSNDGGGDTGSDLMLLELSTAVPAAYNVYYAGWDATNTVSTSGVGIHHPFGDIKKISTYVLPLTSSSFGGNTANTHWQVSWSATANGSGVTEGGSSGSPIFNPNGLIVGTLTGGNSFCNDPVGTDEYGKMSYHWTSNGSVAFNRLKDWLDPDNTGTTSLNGTYAPCNTSTNQVENQQSIRIYPNPATDRFTIDLKEIAIKNGVSVRLYNALGAKIIEEQIENQNNQITLSTGNLVHGLYFVEVQIENQIFTNKLIIGK